MPWTRVNPLADFGYVNHPERCTCCECAGVQHHWLGKQVENSADFVNYCDICWMGVIHRSWESLEKHVASGLSDHGVIEALRHAQTGVAAIDTDPGDCGGWEE